MSTKCDIILCGVGGQGVLSVAAIIASCATHEGYHVKQSEVHGMAQRGGAVMAHLRISDCPIASDLVPEGRADVIIAMEPLESLRYLHYLAKEGTLITSTNPLVNIPDYPRLETLLAKIRSLPRAILLDAERLAKKAGSPKTANMVMVGAASPLLPIGQETIQRLVGSLLAAKGPEMVEANLRAFRLGKDAAPAASDARPGRPSAPAGPPA